MKTKSTALINMKRIAKSICLLVALFLVSLQGFSQLDPGDNPDGPPPAVPLDDYLHLIIIAAGAILAFFVLRRIGSKKTSH